MEDLCRITSDHRVISEDDKYAKRSSDESRDSYLNFQIVLFRDVIGFAPRATVERYKSLATVINVGRR